MPGVYTWADGSTYSGEWFEGLKQGQGLYVYANGDTFEGGYKQGRKQGFGAATWTNGARYQGEWHAGLQHGQGRYTKADGQCYTGTFEHVRACVRARKQPGIPLPACICAHAAAGSRAMSCWPLAASSGHKMQTIYERLCCVSSQAQGSLRGASDAISAHNGGCSPSQELTRPPLPLKYGLMRMDLSSYYVNIGQGVLCGSHVSKASCRDVRVCARASVCSHPSVMSLHDRHLVSHVGSSPSQEFTRPPLPLKYGPCVWI